MMYSKVDHIGIIEEIARGMAISGNNERYLELGIAKAKCFNRVSKYFDVSEAVDINNGASYYIKGFGKNIIFTKATTDEYFNDDKTLEKLFNLIFIDADHHYEAVKKDFTNAYYALRRSGIIILHDTYAPDKESSKHCYDAWKVQDYASSLGLQVVNLPIFYGLTIVQSQPHKDFWYNS